MFEMDSRDSFYFAILHANYHALLNEKGDLPPDPSFSTFEAQCQVINNLLMSKNLILRV